jgi:hypothetical protein
MSMLGPRAKGERWGVFKKTTLPHENHRSRALGPSTLQIPTTPYSSSTCGDASPGGRGTKLPARRRSSGDVGR